MDTATVAKPKTPRTALPAVEPDAGGRYPTLTIPAPQELLDAVDAYAKHLSSKRLGTRVTRAQAVREILIEALAKWQAETAPPR